VKEGLISRHGPLASLLVPQDDYLVGFRGFPLFTS